MNFRPLIASLQTVISIPVTPFSPREEGRIDWERFQSNIHRQVANGVSVLTPNGNTSEFFSLTLEETAQACRAAVESAGPDAIVMPGVGHDVTTAIAMTEDAVRHGVRAIMIHQPAHPFLGRAGWVDYHHRIARRFPDTGFTCYLRDPRIGAAEMRRLCDTTPNFIGIKYAVPNVVAFAEFVRQLQDRTLALICGVAETWAPFFWPAGARGFTSGLVNVATAPSLGLLGALNRGDAAEAMNVWHAIRPFEALRARDQNALNVSVVKEAMHQMGLADRMVRVPLNPVPECDRAKVTAMLTAFGLAPVHTD